MKKTRRRAKLPIRIETVRQLSPTSAALVVGGSGGCNPSAVTCATTSCVTD